MLTLRKASTRLDALNLLEWRNEPTARESALDSHEISWEEHSDWFNRKTVDPQCLLFIAEDMGNPVGAVRIDSKGSDGEVDIVVSPRMRGQGIGTQMLGALVAHARASTSLKKLHAKIKPTNAASRAVFEANGFHHVGQRRVQGQLLDFFECALR